MCVPHITVSRNPLAVYNISKQNAYDIGGGPQPGQNDTHLNTLLLLVMERFTPLRNLPGAKGDIKKNISDILSVNVRSVTVSR